MKGNIHITSSRPSGTAFRTLAIGAAAFAVHVLFAGESSAQELFRKRLFSEIPSGSDSPSFRFDEPTRKGSRGGVDLPPLLSSMDSFQTYPTAPMALNPDRYDDDEREELAKRATVRM